MDRAGCHLVIASGDKRRTPAGLVLCHGIEIAKLA
jgi:hypothetical protein